MLVRKTEVVPIECVVRGYLAGSGWKEYRQQRTVCGIPLPAGLQESQQLPEPIFTPATKEESGPRRSTSLSSRWSTISRAEVSPTELATAASTSIAAAPITRAARGHHHRRHQIRVGQAAGGRVDPDRRGAHAGQLAFLAARSIRAGRSPPSFDKQFVRDWLETTGWDKNSPPPALPSEVVARTREKYIEAYQQLTGKPL